MTLRLHSITRVATPEPPPEPDADGMIVVRTELPDGRVRYSLCHPDTLREGDKP